MITYYVNSSADVVIEAANGGIDTVEATVNYTLPENDNIEALYMLGSGLTGTGSNGAETLHSSGGPNTLVGLGGNDLYYVNNSRRRGDRGGRTAASTLWERASTTRCRPTPRGSTCWAPG